ncbi:HAD family hydrolase [Aquibacillus rhizosphaerae]|uniref:HAD family hydrolase n=1 Tax=Aquibacillus rhizosphaerae TaxID=3051431 RepID=A0ABT7LB04_9BACI|nr:HAD family hydrolase [Aquibacillus sp. LR5S19]MDL4843032.1 HAD family hydrolase [Aquibacillus sp. LR5S19]
MTNYKIIFLDIDGTILQEDHTIEQSTKEAIKQLQAQELEVFLATGRPLHEVYDIAKELNVHSFIGYNGAYAVYKDKVILNEPMPSETIEHYLQVAKKHQHEMVLYTKDKNTFTSMDTPAVKQFIEYFDLKENKLYTNDNKDEILGITVMNVKEDEPLLYDIPEENIYFSQVNVKGLEHSYDVIRENVNKGRAIKTVLDLLQFPQKSAIAFGDGMNDKQMLQYVGESFAMGNGHPDLFQYAKHRTTSVTDSGIFNGLKSLGLVK